MKDNILEIQNLKVIFPTEMGIVRAVEGISLEIGRGKCVALVGESGCGKSVTSLAAMKLLNPEAAAVRVDKLELDGQDITQLSDKEMQELRGKKISMIFQDGECDLGILVCGTGIGISITANKIKGIRAAVCTDCFTAEATRLHNDANILALGGRVVGPGLALKIVDTFLNTPFSNDERHIRRINQIETE